MPRVAVFTPRDRSAAAFLFYSTRKVGYDVVTASPNGRVHLLNCFNLVRGRRCGAEIGASSKPMVAVRVINHVRQIRTKPGVTASYCARCNCATEFEEETE